MTMSFSILLVGIITCAAVFRMLPHVLSRGNLGVDHWYWKLYVETYRRERKFPPDLPQYLLEEHQWYPPFFPLLIANIPTGFFDQLSRIIAIVIDLVRLLLLMGVIYIVSGKNECAVAVAGIGYATTPILISYNIQLNPRGLGALFLDTAFVLMSWILFFNGPLWVWVCILCLAALILLTHKMTTQLFWFLCICMGIFYRDWCMIALIPGSIIVAGIFSKGFYLNIMKSHWDLVTFWHRNWRWFLVHPVYESPVYGHKSYETPGKLYRKGVAGFVKHVRYLLGFAPGGWILILLLIVVRFSSGPLPPPFEWAEVWFVATIFLVVVTLFVPFLKCIGAGYFYLYNAAFPMAILWPLLLIGHHVLSVEWATFFTAVCFSILSVCYYYYAIRSKSETYEGFDDVINYLKTAPDGPVMCLPAQLYEAVAYKTGKSVLWGGHGHGIRKMEDIFPRLKLTMEQIMERYKPRYLLTREGYLPSNFTAEIPCEKVKKFGIFNLYLLRPIFQ